MLQVRGWTVFGGAIPRRIPYLEVLDMVGEGEHTITSGVATRESDVPGQAWPVSVGGAWFMLKVNQDLPGSGQRWVASDGPEGRDAMEDRLSVERGEETRKGGGGTQPKLCRKWGQQSLWCGPQCGSHPSS